MKLFSYDSKLMVWLGILADVMFVNLAFLVCCIPIITIGPARTALYTVATKWTRKETAGLKDFLVAFGQNFLPSLKIWLVLLPLGLFLLADIYCMILNKIPGEILLWIILVPASVLYLLMLSQAFMVQAWFECTFTQGLKNALLLGIAHPLNSIIHLALLVAPLALFLWYPKTFLEVSLVWFLLYFSFEGHFDALLAKKHYERLVKRMEEPEEEETQEEQPEELPEEIEC